MMWRCMMSTWIACAIAATAASHYIRDGASGAADGSDWVNAWDDIPATLVRGDTYYIADGNYATYTANDAVSGDAAITIIKATEADHGTEGGWSSAYGDGQAVFAGPIIFTTSYYTFSGNGTHTVPSDDTDDYGFRISMDSLTYWAGIIQFGSFAGGVSNINVRYTHVYNAYSGSTNLNVIGVRLYPGSDSSQIKIQNCLLENSGSDGIQITNNRKVLIERCYIKRYGKLEAETPDHHGQSVQIHYGGGDDVVFRWNIWEANEGQSMITVGMSSGTGSCDRIRFYGNVVFNKFGETNAASGGFNSSGGIIGNAWAGPGGHNGIYVYHNTFVNIGGNYGGHAHFPMHVPGELGQNEYGYNNLFFNCGGSVGASGWTAWDYHASGGGEAYGGNNEQVGIPASLFSDYEANVFALTAATAAGIDLTSQPWWDESDAFFGTLDSLEDMTGRTRGADGVIDRGAFEFAAGHTLRTAPDDPPLRLWLGMPQ